jgi:predicted dehydrogenase
VSVRIGLMGAASIAHAALIKPAQQIDGVTVAAIAARDESRARGYAEKHGIPKVVAGYQALLDLDDIDAIYLPLPNGLHGHWTRLAIAARKHVLCEKPFTANSDEAAEIAELVDGSGLVVMEAFHYRYHALVGRVLELIEEGTIGDVKHVEANLCFPLPKFSDIRYNLALAGGATMDAGVYGIHAVRTFGPGEPAVRTAKAKLRSTGVDRAMSIDLQYPNGATAHVEASMWSSRVLDISLRIDGTKGRIGVFNYVQPQLYHRLTVRTAAGRRSEKVTGASTYNSQLTAFRDAVVDGAAVLTDAADAVNTMMIVDDAYRAAGLQPRQPSAV